MFCTDLYVKIFPNRMQAKNISSGDFFEISPVTPYAHSRILIGNISAAEQTLKLAIDRVVSKNPFSSIRKRIIVHPVFDFHDGFTEAEERLFRMLAYDAFPSQVVVWIGAELTDELVSQKLNSAT